MFSLIVSILGIALVAALSLVSVYYLGVGLKSEDLKVKAAELLNQSESIRSSIILDENTTTKTLTQNMNELKLSGFINKMPLYKGELWESVDSDFDGDKDFLKMPLTLDPANDINAIELCSKINSDSGHTSAYSLPSDEASIKASVGYGCNHDIGMEIYYFKKI